VECGGLGYWYLAICNKIIPIAIIIEAIDNNFI